MRYALESGLSNSLVVKRALRVYLYGIVPEVIRADVPVAAPSPVRRQAVAMVAPVACTPSTRTAETRQTAYQDRFRPLDTTSVPAPDGGGFADRRV